MASRVRGNVHARFWGGEKAEITSKPYLFLFRTLAKYLSVALDQIQFKDLKDEKNFGDLSVQILNEDKNYYQADNFYDDDYAIAVPF